MTAIVEKTPLLMLPLPANTPAATLAQGRVLGQELANPIWGYFIHEYREGGAKLQT
jgi:hypothetical protein